MTVCSDSYAQSWEAWKEGEGNNKKRSVSKPAAVNFCLPQICMNLGKFVLAKTLFPKNEFISRINEICEMGDFKKI